jgi:hypothetical protein
MVHIEDEKNLMEKLNYHIHVDLVPIQVDKKNQNHMLMIEILDSYLVNTLIDVDIEID